MLFRSSAWADPTSPAFTCDKISTKKLERGIPWKGEDPEQKSERRLFRSGTHRPASARKVSMDRSEPFGSPEVFVVSAGGRAFTWELRQFGGIMLERGPEAFASAALARANGEATLAALCATPGQPTFKRSERP